ncbi:MAG: polymer-forming cytoskeletal protein, partial [Myxococcales bacterium]|nr:polymer-forming cytoskeletal protein [Myxococcales bacterium]
GPKGDQGDPGPLPTVLLEGGLAGSGAAADPLHVVFAGSGVAATAARSDHEHGTLDAVQITHDAGVGGDLTVEGALLVGADSLVDADLSVSGDLTVDGALTVTGDTHLDGPVVMKPGTRVGNTVYGAISTHLPLDATGYNTTPLHIQTEWRCGLTVSVMFNLHFRGFNFIQPSAFEFYAVGYLYGANGYTSANVSAVVPGGITLTSYCSTEGGGPSGGGYVTFRLANAVTWHASDLVVDLVGGGSVYFVNSADTFAVRRMVHSATNL